MTADLWWEIAKYILGAFGALLLYLHKGMDSQIKTMWKRIDELQAAENNKRVDMGIMNQQVTTLTNEMSGIKEELKKLNIQSAKLDVIVEILENRKKNGNGN